MTLEEYNGFCASLRAATHVVQWGGSHVWKVGGKVFAIASLGGASGLGITFKCSDIGFDILREQPGCDQFLAEVLDIAGRSKLIESAVSDGLVTGHHGAQHRHAIGLLVEPARHDAGIAGSKHVDQRAGRR